MAWHYKRNLNPPLFYLCPIRDLLTADLPPELLALDILDGSPPCSTFSMAGSREKAWGKEKHFREGQAKQVLSDLFFDYLDLVARLRPRVAIAENVKGMLIGNAKGYTKLVMARFREIGYRPQLFLVNAADCGVPQRRERVFFCAVRDDMDVPKLVLAPQHRWISAGEATRDLQVLTEAERKDTEPSPVDYKWWPKSVPGEHSGYAQAVERAGIKRKLFNHWRLGSDTPSYTLSANTKASMHWSECRSLTFREWKRLGSFPDDYHAKSDKIGKYMIGMSVPPKMTEQVARAVIDQWLMPNA
jgi:DNA (cytosine-5)-methyltransferase 1